MTVFIVAIHIEQTPPAFPLPAAILKTSLKNNPETKAFDIKIAEYYLPVNITEITAEIISKGADACCFSAYTWNASKIIEAAAELKKLKPDIRLIAGGPQATAESSDFADTGLFDGIIKGEGEDSISEILLNKSDETAIFDSPIINFEATESPYPNILNELERHDGILWEVSRGCPYSCSFCYESRGCKTIRTIPETRMKAELELFREKEIAKIWVLDPTFNHKAEHAERILEAIIDIHPWAHYTFEIRAELMNKKLCEMFSELDASLQLGLQTTNAEALKNINRGLTPDKFLEKCRMMSNFGLTFGIDLIYGLPGDNYETFRNSLDFAVEARPNNIDIFPLSVLPGTEMAEKASALNIKNCGFPDYTIIENKSFSRSDIAKAEALTNAANILYNREQAFAWFNTAAEALKLKPSVLIENFSKHRNDNALDFIKSEFRRKNKTRILPIVESFIKWSRTAESAFANPGKELHVKLCRKPELLDELVHCSAEEFLRRHPFGKDRSYNLYFDGEELYIN